MRLWLPIVVIVLYLFAGYIFCRTDRRANLSPLWGMLAMIVACLVHAVLLVSTMSEGSLHTLNLSIFNVVSLFSWVTACVSLTWLWRHEMALGGVLIAMINAVMVAIASLFVGQKFTEQLSTGMLAHILISIAAWTLLSISLIYSVLYTYIYQRLKQKKIRNMNAASLSNLERVMMLYILAGWILLLASLASGLMYVANMFAPNIRYITILTMLSALLYTWTLWLYYLRHCHAMVLVYWAVAAYASLVAGYVISNIILQFLV